MLRHRVNIEICDSTSKNIDYGVRIRVGKVVGMNQKPEIMNISLVIRVSLAVVLGVLASVAFIAGGSLFEGQGQETLAGYVALILFCAVCQFLLTRRGRGGFAANWPILACMIGGLLAGRALGLCPSWPQFAAATSGAVAGALGCAVLSPRQTARINLPSTGV